MATTFIDHELSVGSGGGGYELPEEGSYVIEFHGIVDKKDWPRTAGKDGINTYDEDGEPMIAQKGDPLHDADGNPLLETSLTLQFSINEPEDPAHGTEFRDYFPAYVSSGNKSGRLWAALLGTTPDKLPIPLPRASEFAGKKAQASLTHRRASNGKSYLKIDSVVALRKRKPARQLIEDDDEPGF